MVADGDDDRVEPTYGREIFECLRQTLDVVLPNDAVIASQDYDVALNYDILDGGLWLKMNGNVDALDWSPACDFPEHPCSPDPLMAPALPFPFTARQLAAFMLDGWGWALAERFGGISGALDTEVVGLLLGGVHAAKPREAIEAAFAALENARQQVGDLDPALAEAESKARAGFDNAQKEAERETAWREGGISEDERRVRVQRRNEIVAKARAAYLAAGSRSKHAYVEWRKAMVRRLLMYPPLIAGSLNRPLSREEWDRLSFTERMLAWWRGDDPVPTPEQVRQRLIDWYDAVYGAERWFQRSRVTAEEAAQLLSGNNPDEEAPMQSRSSRAEWLEVTTREMRPHDRVALLGDFLDVGGERPLIEWWHLAKERGWHHDRWIDKYIEARELHRPVQDTATTDAAPSRPPPQQRYQEQEILRVLAELGFSATALPRGRPGVPGPKADTRAKLPSFTRTVFDKAWERLRASGEIADA